MARARSLLLTNDTSAVMAVYVEPYPNEYWMQPGDRVLISGRPRKRQIEVIPFDGGLTIWFGEDPDPTVTAPDGSPVQPGRDRP